MARLDWGVSVTPIETVGGGVDGDGVTTEVLSHNFQRTIGGGNSSGTWAGNDTSEWNSGVPTCISSDAGNITPNAGADGLWFKHTGFNYDAAEADNIGSTVNTAKVTISIGVGGETPSQVICRLNAGEAIFFPEPVNAQFSLSDNGVAAAVEVAVFT